LASVLAQVCAELLAGIWAREGRIDEMFFKELYGPALDEVLGVFGARAPHRILCRSKIGLGLTHTTCG
jgi:hypothetical protein